MFCFNRLIGFCPLKMNYPACVKSQPGHPSFALIKTNLGVCSLGGKTCHQRFCSTRWSNRPSGPKVICPQKIDWQHAILQWGQVHLKGNVCFLCFATSDRIQTELHASQSGRFGFREMENAEVVSNWGNVTLPILAVRWTFCQDLFVLFTSLKKPFSERSLLPRTEDFSQWPRPEI